MNHLKREGRAVEHLVGRARHGARGVAEKRSDALSAPEQRIQGLTDAETSAIVSTPGKIDTISCWGIFVEQEPGRYRVRLRSKTHPINEIAKRHEGGGHPLASGANSYSLEENDQIYHELQEVAKKT